MRIASVCYWSVFRNDGVAQKIVTQAREWELAGHEAAIFALSPQGSSVEQQWPARAFLFSGLAGRPLAATRLLRELRTFEPDVVYLRYELLPPPLHRLPRLFRTVVELNSDEHAEYPGRVRRARLADRYGRANWRLLFGRAAGIVCVTHELVRLVERYRRPVTVIANGIDLDGIDPLPALASGRPAIAFSGTPGQAWHGIDKLIALAAAHPELDVVLLGLEGPAGLPGNVSAPGYLSRAEYEPLLARVDAALGTAALHRKGMTEACPLKVREYLAYGLPVVLPYDDPDLGGLDEQFVLRLPNTEGNLVEHAGEIVRFVSEARGRRVPREAVEARIGAREKERRRLALLESVLAA